jgi:hypothetical protein
MVSEIGRFNGFLQTDTPFLNNLEVTRAVPLLMVAPTAGNHQSQHQLSRSEVKPGPSLPIRRILCRPQWRLSQD